MDETAFTSRRNSKGPSTGPWGTPEASSNGLIKDQYSDRSRTSGREEEELFSQAKRPPWC